MALNKQMQKIIQQDIQDAETRPKEEILKEQMEGLKTVGRTARDIAVESIPGVSESLAEKRIDEAMQRGDTTGAMIEGAAGLMGAVPMVGDVAAKGLRAVTKSFRKKDISEAEKLVDNAEKLQEWRDANRLPESQRQKNIPEAQQAAEDLFQGNIKSKEARKRIRDVFPEPELYTAETMPEMPTITDVVGSMGKKAEKGILGVKGFDLEPGQRVGARLDIPAYNEYDKWVVSIHDGKIRNGSVVGYGQAVRLKNIEFGSDPEVALDIAKGKRVAKKSGEEKPMGKATIARVFGDYIPEDPYALQEFARKVLADKDSGWTQVGMNPYRGSYFYNKETGNVVTRADEVIQVGPLVLAKNVTEPKLSELKELFSQKTARTKDGKIRVFNEGGAVPMNTMAKQMELFEPVQRGFNEGGLMDEGGMVDEMSGNEVPPGSLREEVRDDIPAQLSEGEFVFPADVVRYFGLEKLMKMRQEAKAGLARMEAMGQMGNSDEATLPDDIPFDVEDLEIENEEDDLEFQVGGYVPGMSQRPMMQPQPYSPYGQPQPYSPYGQPQPYSPYGQPLPSVYRPEYYSAQPSLTYTSDISNLPTFQQTIGPGVPYVDFDYVEYENDAGQIVRLRKSKTTGKLLDPVPAGFRPKSEKVTTQTTQVSKPIQDDGGGDRDTTDPGGAKDVTGIGYDRSKISSSLQDAISKYGAGFGTLTDTFVKGPTQAFSQIPGISNLFGAIKKEPTALANAATSAAFGGVLDNIRGVVGGALDYGISRTGAPNRQYTDTTPLDQMDERNQGVIAGIANVVMPEIQSLFQDSKGNAIESSKALSNVKAELSRLGLSPREIDKLSKKGGNFNQLEKLTRALGNLKVQEIQNTTDANRIDTVSKAVVDASEKAKAAEKKGNVARDAGIIGREITSSDVSKAKEEAASAPESREDMGGFRDDGSSEGGSRAGGGMRDSGDVGYGSGTDCLTEDMKVKLNGAIDFVTNIKVGDMIDNYKVKEVLHKHMREGYYSINNELKISNDHPVLANGTWTRPEDLVVGDSINGIPVVSLEYVDRMTPTVSIVIDGDSFDVYTEGNTYTVHGRYKEIRQQAA